MGLLAAGPVLVAGGAALHAGALIVGIFGVQRAVGAFQPAAMEAAPSDRLLPRLQRTVSVLALFFRVWVRPLQQSAEFGRDQQDAAAAQAQLARVEVDALSRQSAGAILEVLGAACAEKSPIVVRVTDGERGAPRVWKPLWGGKGEAAPAFVTGDCGAPLRVEVLGTLHRSVRQEAERAKVRRTEGAVGLRALRVSSAEGLAEAGLVALAELSLRAMVVAWLVSGGRRFTSAQWRPGR